MENTKASIDFADVRTAFHHKNTRDLRFTWWMFSALQHPRLVKGLTFAAQVILRYKLPVKSLIRATVFRVFCAGENIREAISTIKRLRTFNVRSVLDYVAEAADSPERFSANMQTICENVKRLADAGGDQAISIKLSALEDHHFFWRINERGPLTPEDNKRYLTLMKGLKEICGAARSANVVVYIDAEDRFMQDGFDRIVESLMAEFNREGVVVYNTLQMYLVDRLDYLKGLLKRAEDAGYFPGVKLVRGAYVEKEREAARLAGIPSPVFADKKGTDDSYNRAVDLCISNHRRVYTCIASHNEFSTRLAIDCMNRYGVTDNKKVTFSQLLGMSDHLTFNLAAAGYISSKYLPYGEVEKAIPYLIRRAEENSSVKGQVTAEAMYLKKELRRRKRESAA